MPLALLVNPASARREDPEAAAARSRQALDARRAVFRVERTKGLEHGVEQALRAVEAGEVPVVISGDGLIGAIGGAMAGSETPLGIIPGGRGNDLARVLGIPDDPEAAVDASCRRAQPPDRRRRGQRQALPRHRQRRLRLRSQPARQRNQLPARQPRLRLRRDPHPDRLEAGPLHDPGRRASATASPATRSRSPTAAPSAAACTSPPTPSSTTASSTSSRSARSASCASWVTCRRCSRAPTSSEDEVRVFRAPQLELSASRPFPVYADGEHLTDLPASLRVLPRAARACSCPRRRRLEPDAPRARHRAALRRQARARAGGRRRQPGQRPRRRHDPARARAAAPRRPRRSPASAPASTAARRSSAPPTARRRRRG